MRAIPLLILLALSLPAPTLAVDELDFSTVGIYGTAFEFCDFTCLKMFPRPEFYERYAQWIRDADARGQFVMVGLYTYDRVTLKGTIEEYIAKTDELLAALPLDLVDIVFLNEENITWNNGFAIQNALYDHVKQAHPELPVYQWFTPNNTPHAGMGADGWIIDAYGLGGQRFRTYLAKYVATGLPVINCVTASPMIGELQSAQDQVDICREFNIPMFFFAVDDIEGNPVVWLESDDPRLAQWRGWFMRVREMAHSTDTSLLPLPSAQWSYGIPLEVAAAEDGTLEYLDDFSGQKLIDDATIEGLLNTRWDSFGGRLGIDAGTQATFTWHLWSEFEIRAPSVSFALDGAEEAVVSWSADGMTWQGVEPGVPVADFSGRNLWVRLSISAGDDGAWLDDLRITGRNVLPEARVVEIVPQKKRGVFEYVDGFDSTRALHLAEIEGGEFLEWRRGSVGVRGHDGATVRSTLRWHFVAPQAIERAKVLIESYHHKSLAAHNQIGVSLDGETPLLTATTRGLEDANGSYVGTTEFDLSSDERFAGATEFWVHFTMINSAGIHTNGSNDIRRLEVSGALREE
jgi:hypothetical protein